MKAILIPQHSQAELAMKVTWDAKERKVKTRPFDEIAERFPDCVTEYETGDIPHWGSAYYIKGEDGGCLLVKQNWDTSD